jgi:hypothetical protein
VCPSVFHSSNGSSAGSLGKWISKSLSRVSATPPI